MRHYIVVDPKKVLLLIEPPKSAQTLKKRSKTQKVYPTKGLPEKSATMEAPGIYIYIYIYMFLVSG